MSSEQPSVVECLLVGFVHHNAQWNHACASCFSRALRVENDACIGSVYNYLAQRNLFLCICLATKNSSFESRG